jgi:hypothetical protein
MVLDDDFAAPQAGNGVVVVGAEMGIGVVLKGGCGVVFVIR